MEVEHCIKTDGEEIQNFLHRIKRTVDKGWPDDIEAIAAAGHGAERAAQGRQRRQRYIDYSLKGLRLSYLQRRAQEYLMENPNGTWNDFWTRISQREVSFQVSSNFLNNEKQTKAQIATLGQEMKNLRSEPQEHRVSAVEGNPRTVDPNQKRRQNATRFCNYCRTNRHTSGILPHKQARYGTKNWNELKMKELPKGRLHSLKIRTKNEDQIMDQSTGLEANVSKEEIRITIMMDLEELFPHLIKTSLQDTTSHMTTIIRKTEDHMINAQISHSIE